MKKIVFVLILLQTVSTYANNYQADSIRIVNLFKIALQTPNKGDSINNLAKLTLKKTKNNLIINDTYHYQLALFLFQTAQLDSAKTIANNGLLLTNANAYKSFKFHNILGSIYLYKNDHTLAVSEFQTTIKILEKYENFHQAALIKNNLANVFFSLHDYQSSYKYSKESYLQLKQEKDSVYLPSLTGVFAVSAAELGHINEAKKLANESLKLSILYNNTLGLIVSNYCLGDVNVSQNNFNKAAHYFIESLNISKQVKHKHFITLNKIGLLNVYYNLKQFKKAILFGEQALKESIEQKNNNSLFNIHKTLGRSYAHLKNYEKAYLNINEAHIIYKNSATLENKKAINDILVKYDTEKKEKELTKNKLTIAQDDIKLNKRKQWIIGLLSILFLVIISYFFYHKIQNQKLIQIKKDQEQKRILALLNGEEKERERISNELHDGVASSITAIKIQLEHLNSENKDKNISQLVSQLSILHEETRRLSHNLMPIGLNNNGFLKTVESYCIENSTDKLSIHFTNLIQKKIIFPTNTATILYRVLQELINNVNKHSKSKICYVQTFMIDNYFAISVEDEGIGFNLNSTHNSQGINSIKKRINDLGGVFTIDSNIGKGTLTLIKIKL